MFEQAPDGTISATLRFQGRRGVGVGFHPEEHRDPNCPLHGTEAERVRAYIRRREHLLSWRKIRQTWPKARRDAAKAIDLDWREVADPEGEYWSLWR